MEKFSAIEAGSFSHPTNTRNAIVGVLSRKWPLSAKELHAEVEHRYRLGLSYQSVHKLVNKMVQEETVAAKSSKFMLNPAWLSSLKKFSELAQKSYSKHGELLEVCAASSVDKDAFVAGKEAAQKALSQLKFNKQVQLVIVFASGAYKGSYSELLAGVQSVSKKAPLAGCTTTGEINDGHLKNSVTVVSFAADAKVFSAKPISLELSQSHYDGSGFGELLNQLEKRAGFKENYPDLGLFFFPGYSLENDMKTVAPSFLSEFASRFSTPFPIAGCLSGDIWAFKNTAQFCNGKVLPKSIVFVAITTRLKFGVRRTHGYASESGRCFKIKSKDGLIVSMAKISGGKAGKYEPMLDIYCREVKMRPEELKASIPRFISEIFAQNKCPPITRVSDCAHGYPGRVDGKGIWFENSFKTGDVVQVSTTTPEELVNITKKAIVEAATAASVKKPEVALLFSCASLEAILQGHDVDEIARIRKKGLEGVKVVGCYIDGEIGPVAVPQGNGTVVAIVFGNELRN